MFFLRFSLTLFALWLVCACGPSIEPAASIGESTTGRKWEAPAQAVGIEPVVVDAEKRVVFPSYFSIRGVDDDRLVQMETPTPKRPSRKSAFLPETDRGPLDGLEVDALTSRALDSSFETTDYDTNSINNGGFVFIPPDCHGAAGPDHLVNVTNATIRFHQKGGTLDFDTGLASFFASLSPVNGTFDPRVIYDQFEDRFIVVTLERRDTASGDATNSSRMLLAVSDDSDPNGIWTFTAVDTELEIGGTDSWLDYPCLAIDEEAVYITGSMFNYLSLGGAFAGTRIWIVDKGTSGGFYDGMAASITGPLDPYASTGNPAVSQPAHVFGTAPAGIGTFLVSYNGLTNGATEFLQVVRVDDPLGSPSFVHQYVAIDDLEAGAPFPAFPDSPQDGTGFLIDSGDRRTYDAVWRDDSLWVTTSILPITGEPSEGEPTAIWLEVDTSSLGALVVADFGTIGGEDIATGTHTSYSSIMVNGVGTVVIGFTAADDSFYPSSYYTWREAGDMAGVTHTPELLRGGTDWYQRTFGGSNRWGDYSSVVLDPVDECFWIYNQHAIARGSTIGGESGRWGTAFGKFCPDGCPDTDGDGVCNDSDICPGSDDGNDADGDGVPDGCDACPGSDDGNDADGDGVPDGCDACPGSDDGNDADGDGVPDGCDACPGSDDGNDADGDGVPDGCDVCPGSDDGDDADGDSVPDGCDICPGSDDGNDADGDGVPEGCDNCPGSDDAMDSDGDGVPNGCDTCPGSDDTADSDGDGIPDGCDLCPGSDDGIDTDGDGVPDGCDTCPGSDDGTDSDGDGVPDGCDICPGSDDNDDSDGDGVPDGCDICPLGDDHIDLNDNDIPDACECDVLDEILDQVPQWPQIDIRALITTANNACS